MKLPRLDKSPNGWGIYRENILLKEFPVYADAVSVLFALPLWMKSYEGYTSEDCRFIVKKVSGIWLCTDRKSGRTGSFTKKKSAIQFADEIIAGEFDDRTRVA